MELGFTWFDFAALVVLGLSGVMAFARGLIREVFSIIAFIGGAIAAVLLSTGTAQRVVGVTTVSVTTETATHTVTRTKTQTTTDVHTVTPPTETKTVTKTSTRPPTTVTETATVTEYPDGEEGQSGEGAP